MSSTKDFKEIQDLCISQENNNIEKMLDENIENPIRNIDNYNLKDFVYEHLEV